jgi:hypothetical protein
MIRKIALFLAVIMLTGLSIGTSALAQEVDVAITNLTPGQAISPPLVFSHSVPFALGGSSSSPGIELLAEGGDSSVLQTEIANILQVAAIATASAPVPPGGTVTLTVQVPDGFDYVTALGMLVTTNDTFFALVAQKIPGSTPATYYANAWDAGTEVNNESCNDIPGPPCGGSGPGGTDEGGFMHISSGIHGIGDLDQSTHGWQNPVVQIVISKK